MQICYMNFDAPRKFGARGRLIFFLCVSSSPVHCKDRGGWTSVSFSGLAHCLEVVPFFRLDGLQQDIALLLMAWPGVRTERMDFVHFK